MRSALPLATALLGAAPAAQLPAHVVDGAVANDTLGIDVAFVGDVNGDGTTDFVSGATAPGTPGHALVISGKDGSTLLDLQGVDTMGEFGLSVDGAGDTDLDGVPDVIVGAPFGFELMHRGRARVFSGASGAALFDVTGANIADLAGRSVAGLGDVNGDGHSDVAVGIPGFDAPPTFNAGSVRVVSGADGLELYTVVGEGDLGYSLDALSDIDLDGVGDWVAGGPGANGGSGRIEVRSGDTGSLIHAFDGTAPFEGFGQVVAGAGDVSGDGFEDVLIASPSYSDLVSSGVGLVEVRSGANGSLLAQLFGGGANELFGSAVDTAGDLDGDGRSEILVGTSNAGQATGAVWAYSIATGAVVWSATGTGGSFGSSVAGGVDIGGGSGEPDVLIGSHGFDGPAGTNAGRVEVFTPFDLVLCIAPSAPPPGTAISFTTLGGAAGRPVGLFLTSLGGSSLLEFLLPGVLDGAGSWSFVLPADPGFSGLTFGLTTAAVNATASGVQISNEAFVAVQ